MRSIHALVALVVLVFGSTILHAQSAAGLRWTTPAGWQTAPEQPMRAATYRVPPAPGDSAPGECAVYFFGAGQGGSVADNLDRWKGQFTGADGKPSPAKTARLTVNGIPVTTIDVSGTYSGMGGPMAASKPVPGYRLLGAIVEGPGGSVFVKFTGPQNTVMANQAKFDTFLKSFQKAR
ncbi:MAG TPA: hypothetical protein VJP86_15315 [Vicinamibacterales bacterium]|jgi:hypothetical protein|nr:hypothetical protein [Vicinamibacterales bacterium]